MCPRNIRTSTRYCSISLVPRPKNLRLGSVEFRVRYHPKSRDQKGGIPPFSKLSEMFRTCCRQHSDSIVDGRTFPGVYGCIVNRIHGIIMSVLSSAVDPGVFEFTLKSKLALANINTRRNASYCYLKPIYLHAASECKNSFRSGADMVSLEMTPDPDKLRHALFLTVGDT